MPSFSHPTTKKSDQLLLFQCLIPSQYRPLGCMLRNRRLPIQTEETQHPSRLPLRREDLHSTTDWPAARGMYERFGERDAGSISSGRICECLLSQFRPTQRRTCPPKAPVEENSDGEFKSVAGQNNATKVSEPVRRFEWYPVVRCLHCTEQSYNSQCTQFFAHSYWDT